MSHNEKSNANQVAPKENKLRSALRLYAIIWQQTPLALILTLIFTILEAAHPFVNIVLPASLLGELMGAQEPARIQTLLLLWVGLNFAFFILGKGLHAWRDALTPLLQMRTDYEVVQKTLKMDYEHIEDPSVHVLHQGIRDAQQYTGGFYHLLWALEETMLNVFSLVIACFLLVGLFAPAPAGLTGWQGVIASPYASAGLIVFLIIMLLISLKLLSKQMPLNIQFQKDVMPINRKYGYLSEEYINNYHNGKDIRLFGSKDMLQDYENRFLKSSLEFLVRMFDQMGWLNGGAGIISGVSVGGIYLLIGLKVLAGALPIESLVLYAGAASQISGAVRKILESSMQLATSTNALRNFTKYLDLPPIKKEGDKHIFKRDSRAHEIEFQNVSFHYPGSEKMILQNLSMKLNVGERLAVVGRNGAGKTTFIKLLCRLYDPTEGKILLDGVDIREISLEEYFALFSVVFQDFALFSFSLKQNIFAGMHGSKSRALDSLEQAGLKDRLATMPDGLETNLYRDFEENGVEISGGEAQKIAISRALYKDAPFIVLDEPTAALDPLAEFEIYSKFDGLVGNKTAIYISHRLSSCRFCHDIAVFDQGNIVQRGDHDALLADEKGPYAALWHAQAQYYANPNTTEALSA